MIYRTYGCNHCDIEFTSGDEDPECPKCKGMELHWVPVAGHGGILSGATKASDDYFKTQAKRFGFTNFHNARQGEAMAPRDPTPPRHTAPVQVAPGISVPIPMNSSNQPLTSIQNWKPAQGMQPAFGNGLPVSDGNRPSMRELTNVTARYDGK